MFNSLRNPNKTVLLIIAYLAFIVIGMPLGVLNIAWTYMQTTFDVSLASLGVLLTLSTVGQLAVSFTGGRLIARLGFGRFLLSGTTLLGVGLLGYMLSPSWPVLLVSVILTSMGSGTLDVGLNIFTSSHYSAGRLNWLHAAFGMGVTLGPIVATLIIVTLGQSWRWSYACILVMQLALAACFLFTLKHWTLKSVQDTQHPGLGVAGVAETLRLTAALLLLALFFFYGGAEIGIGQLSNTLFIQGRGVDQATSSFWISLYWASFTIGRALIGIFIDRLSKPALLRATMIGAAIGAALLWQNLVPVLSFAGVVVIGFALAPMFATLVSETSRYVSARYTPTLIGFEVGITTLGGALLPGLGGLLGERLGLGAISPFLFGVTLAMLVMYEVINLHHAQAVVVPAASET